MNNPHGVANLLEELTEINKVDVEPVAVKLRGINIYLPSQLIEQLRYAKGVITLGFSLPRELQSAINQHLGKRGRESIRFAHRNIDPELFQQVRKEFRDNLAIGGEELNTLVRREIRVNRLEVPPGVEILYFGEGLGTLGESSKSDNNLLDVNNVNSWLYWGALEFCDRVRKDVKEAFKLISRDSSKLSVTISRGGEVDLRIYSVPIISKEVNYLDKLVYRCFINRVAFSREMLIYPVLLTLLWNAGTTATGRRANPAGQIRKMLQGAVDRPLREDMETGNIEELDVESTVDWWSPTSYYYRSPVALRGQPLRVTHCKFTFAQERFIWNRDSGGHVVNNSHLKPNQLIKSLPGAQSKVEKISNRCTLFFANRVEVCEKVKRRNEEIIEVIEHESPLKFAGQKDGFVFTHYQGRYSLAESCIGMYVQQTPPANMLNYLDPTSKEVEIVQGQVVPTQTGLVHEFAKELGIELEADEEIEPISEFVEIEDLFT